MAQISYIKLYNYLTEIANYERISALRTIFRLRKLPKELLSAVSQIIENKTPNICINDVSFEDLVEKDGMRPIAAILMLDWLRREPEAALTYLSECTLRSPIMHLTDQQHNELDQAIAQLEKEVKDKVESANPYDDSSEDINVDSALNLDEGKTSLQEFIDEIHIEDSLNEKKESKEQTEIIDIQDQISNEEGIQSKEVLSKEQGVLEQNQTSVND